MNKIKQEQIKSFDPNGVGIENGNFIGLPFDENTADIIIYPVPWDVTVSYGTGTSLGPQNVLDASYQLDLFLEDMPDFWKRGLFFQAPDEDILARNIALRKRAEPYIQHLESGKNLNEEKRLINELEVINKACKKQVESVHQDTSKWLNQNKKVALLGGDHSSPLGYIKALSEIHEDFGILQIDAHADLRKAYEGFTYSHASIFYNVLKDIPQVSKLIQIGVRDYCHEEAEKIQNNQRIKCFTDQYIHEQLFEGNSWSKITEEIIDALPNKIYLSLDIDGLNPGLCPNTGTPVPGGFSFNQICFLIQKLRESHKECIGLDLCEVAGKGAWDGNVGARILYRLMTLL